MPTYAFTTGSTIIRISKAFLWAQDKNADNSLGFDLNYTGLTRHREMIKGAENFSPQTVEQAREILTEICETGKLETSKPAYRKLTQTLKIRTLCITFETNTGQRIGTQISLPILETEIFDSHHQVPREVRFGIEKTLNKIAALVNI